MNEWLAEYLKLEEETRDIEAGIIQSKQPPNPLAPTVRLLLSESAPRPSVSRSSAHIAGVPSK